MLMTSPINFTCQGYHRKFKKFLPCETWSVDCELYWGMQFAFIRFQISTWGLWNVSQEILLVLPWFHEKIPKNSKPLWRQYKSFYGKRINKHLNSLKLVWTTSIHLNIYDLSLPTDTWWWWWWWWWIVFVVWLTNKRCLALFPAGIIVRDPHHRESLTRRKQGLNLRRTWVQS